jgi:hypothetical protein
MTPFSKLCFSSTNTITVNGQVAVSAQFNCPVCKQHPKLTKYITLPTDRDLDANGEVNYTFPCCGAKNTLYLAVYQKLGTTDYKTQFSVKPIAADWYKPKETC